jgi:hypothetical protein
MEALIGYMPGWHDPHDVDEGELMVPTGQLSQPVLPYLAAYMPGRHWVQVSELEEAENVPGLQGMHKK